MKKILVYKISSGLLALLILFSAIGVAFNAHYCRTAATVEKTILPFSADCEHGEATACNVDDIEYKKSSKQCCANEKMPMVKGETCCSDTTTYISGLSDFEVPKINVKSLFNAFLITALNVLDLFTPPVDNSKPTSFFKNAKAPPPLSGKALAIAMHQLKIDLFLL